ncbi:MAG: single-stranded-DNA-specific exonuclease RecJ [Acidobacteria bacterium]|nr:single-stranded-DNA-specific exonuclease RecJ [Acidobacteriota bacterium]MBI3426515.1 single-stranded-DNA-specific exonuclease RecJ [Acidobacteriota bacterium]
MMILAPTKITRGLTGARWQMTASSPANDAALKTLQAKTGEDELVLRCLLNRGLTDAKEISQFLNPEFPASLHSPTLLRDMPLAVERLRQAIQNRERILVVTDFDVDGTTSSVILSQVLRLLGGEGLLSCYIPDRFTEGYGLSKQIVEKAANEGIKLILTADIGIKSHAEARLAKELGIDLIICDHHLPDGEDVPADAFAVLCPKGSSGEGYPNKHLAACGVSLKLAEALLAEHPKRAALLSSLAKLSAIGTVADMVDLSSSENRAIVRHGLQALSEPTPNPGLRALLKVAQVGNPVTTFDVGFRLGPRINAAGRIAHANAVLSLFDAKTDAEAAALAQSLDELNKERQQIQLTLQTRLLAFIDFLGDRLERVLVLSGKEADGFHRGVVGIACSKLVEKTGRPTLIAAINEEGMAHGSARSIDGFHIVEAMDSVSDLFVKYGGHPMAAGFTIKADKLDELKYRLNRYAAEMLDDEALGRRYTADAEIKLAQITPALVRSLERLEPHGSGNPQPLFWLPHVQLRLVQVLKEKHLKLALNDGTHSIPALWWNAVEYQKQLTQATQTGHISVLCRPEINNWNNRETCQLKVIDVAVE